MTSLEVEFKIPGGERMFQTIYPAEMLNQIRKTGNDAMFLDKVLNIFNELDFDSIELDLFQKSIIFSNSLKLFGIEAKYIASDFLDWCIETKAETGIDTSDSANLFDEFVKSKSKQNG
jgi:hypothetical protein